MRARANSLLTSDDFACANPLRSPPQFCAPASPTTCLPFTGVLYVFDERESVTAAARDISVGTVGLASASVCLIKLASQTVKLLGKSTPKLTISATSDAVFSTNVGVPFPIVYSTGAMLHIFSAAIASFDQTQITQRIGFGLSDLAVAVLAMLNMSLAVYVFLFPSAAKAPWHFRWSAHGRGLRRQMYGFFDADAERGAELAPMAESNEQ
eukprot:c8510_g1_i1.p2 GENE.c8510_g1_i1~~c8510_g1_i1.p2  ORF type:complete len:210 (+),score=31.60 c8510_g1_i1:602-1231(+)